MIAKFKINLINTAILSFLKARVIMWISDNTLDQFNVSVNTSFPHQQPEIKNTFL